MNDEDRNFSLIDDEQLGNVADMGNKATHENSKEDASSMSAASKGRGFAAMSPDRQREIASQGGRAAHQKGTAHQFTSEEAREAGRIGGQNSRSGKSNTLSSEEE